MNLKARIRGPGLIPGGWKHYLAVETNQPLLLIREPNNPADSNAIVVATLHGERFGYVEREAAAIMAPSLDAGTVWLGRILKTPVPHFRHCIGLFWIDEAPRAKKVKAKKSKQKQNELEPSDEFRR